MMKQSPLVAFAFGIVLSASCKKEAETTFTRPPISSIDISMPASGVSSPKPAAKKSIQTRIDEDFNRLIDKKYGGNPAGKEAVQRDVARLNALDDAEKKLAELYRRTMITPPPAGFKPEPVAHKIRLSLALEKVRIHRGERLRFHLEMMNVGREAIVYSPLDESIFKSGSLTSTRNIHFILTNPQKERSPLQPPLPLDDFQPTEIKFPEGITAAEKMKWLRDTNAMGQAGANFEVELKPGETLRSLGDGDSVQERYRTLVTERDDPLDKPGTYRLQVELDDRPSPLSKGYIEANLRSGDTLEEIHKTHERRMKEALGPISSNIVTIEVAR